MADSNPRQAGTLTVTGQTGQVHGKKIDIILAGTWVGTVKLQRQAGATPTFYDTGDEWTANAQDVAEAASNGIWRLDWTRTSGSLIYDIRGG